MLFKYKLSIVIIVMLLFFSVFWCLQTFPFIHGENYQASLVTYQGFFNLRYITGYYLMIFLPSFYFLFPDIKNFELVRFESRLSFFYQRFRKTFIFSMAFSLMLCTIVLIGTSLFFNITTLVNQDFYLAILIQFFQFTLVYGIISNCSNILVDIFNNVVVSAVTVVVAFILLTNIIFFELEYSFFFDDVLIVNYIFKGDLGTSLFIMSIIRMCTMYVISFLISRYFFLLRDIK